MQYDMHEVKVQPIKLFYSFDISLDDTAYIAVVGMFIILFVSILNWLPNITCKYAHRWKVHKTPKLKEYSSRKLQYPADSLTKVLKSSNMPNEIFTFLQCKILDVHPPEIFSIIKSLCKCWLLLPVPFSISLFAVLPWTEIKHE